MTDQPTPGAGVRPPAPLPPEKPLPGDCCGGGCARCVFDLYEEALERYQRELAAWQSQR